MYGLPIPFLLHTLILVNKSGRLMFQQNGTLGKQWQINTGLSGMNTLIPLLEHQHKRPREQEV